MNNMHPIQREYLVYLLISVPPMEAWQQHMQYLSELYDIRDKDYTREIKTPVQILERVAQQRGITLQEYQQELCDEMRDADEHVLKVKYGIIDESTDAASDIRTATLDKYHKLLERLESNPDNSKLTAIQRFYSKPHKTGEPSQ